MTDLIERDYDKMLEYVHENDDSYYSDWLQDNIEGLRREYCDSEPDEFNSFCKEAFREYKEMS